MMERDPLAMVAPEGVWDAVQEIIEDFEIEIILIRNCKTKKNSLKES
jgi:hypothetical protein